MSRSWTRRWITTAVLLAVAGCHSSGGSPENMEQRKLVSLTLTPGSSATLVAGQERDFRAHGSFSDGTSEELTSSVSWSTSDTAIVSVSEEGRATGVTVGSAQLTASSEGIRSNTATVEVSAPERPVLILRPSRASTPLGDPFGFIATLTRPDGSSRDVTLTATWASSDPAVATVDTGGVATGAGVGTATFTAAHAGVTSNTVTLEVRPAEIQVVIVTPKTA